MSKFSSFPWSKQNRSLCRKLFLLVFFFFFCILSGEICKQLQSQATGKQVVLLSFLPSIFNCSYISFRSRDKRGHLESIWRNHMLHFKQRLSAPFEHIQPLQKEFHSQFLQVCIYILMNRTTQVLIDCIWKKSISSPLSATKSLCILWSSIPKNILLELLSIQNAFFSFSIPLSPSHSS